MTGSLVTFESWAALAGDSPISRTEWAAIDRRLERAAPQVSRARAPGRRPGAGRGAGGAASDPDAVALAAWYHDIAYDPERDDNEQVSAERARAGLRGLVPEDRVDEVARLVLLTAGHDAEPGDANGAVLCDADLAVLAGPPDAYAAYASAMRTEYGHLSDEEFTAGRIAVLERLLALPRLYRLPAVADEWTPRARANLTAELTLLRSRGASDDGAPPPAAG